MSTKYPSTRSFQPNPPNYPQPSNISPFHFLRLKTFSTHTNHILSKLESAITNNPNHIQNYLDLAEEYIRLGSRTSALKVYEYSINRFPNESNPIKTKNSIPPPNDKQIQMKRTHTYDYKWRHRESLFPKRIYKLDVKIDPYGQQCRKSQLHFFQLVRNEQYKGKKTNMIQDRLKPEIANQILCIIPPFHNKQQTQQQTHMNHTHQMQPIQIMQLNGVQMQES
jgi:hypothetical protein